METRLIVQRFWMALSIFIMTGILAACSENSIPGTSTPTPIFSPTAALAQATGTPNLLVSPTNTKTPAPHMTPYPDPTRQFSPTPIPKPSASTGSLHFPCASPGSCGFPDANNTGVPAGTQLIARTGNLTIRTNGTILSGINLTGSLDIYANNVIIENSVISSTNWWGINLRAGYSNLKILHCTIIGVVGKGIDGGGEDYGINNMGEGAMEVAYTNLSGFADVLQMDSGNIHDNYVHDIQFFHHANNGSITHTDAFIATGGNSAALTLEHNTFLNQTTTAQGASSAIALYADFGTVTNSTVDNNWLAGGAYALYAGMSGSTNVKITHNVFSTQYWKSSGYYGSVAYWYPNDSGNVFSGNVFSDGSPVSP